MCNGLEQVLFDREMHGGHGFWPVKEEVRPDLYIL